MASERPRERSSFSGAWFAIPVGVALAPAFLRAPTESGVDALALAALAIAASITLAIAVGLGRRSSAASIGALAIGPSIASVLAARVAAEQPVAAGLAGEGGSLPLLTTFVAVVLAAAGARAVELDGAQRGVRRAMAVVAGGAVLGAVMLAGVALVRGEAPPATERLAAIVPTSVLEVMVEDGAQTARVEPHFELRRICDGNFCELVAHVDHGNGYEVGSRRPLPDELDRAPLAIVPMNGVVAVVPLDRHQRLDWLLAMAFDTATARAAHIGVGDMIASVAPPRSWRVASWIGLAIALAALALSVRAERGRAQIDRGTDAIALPDGTLRLEGGEVARGPRGVDPGPIVVLDRADRHATYREDGLATIARFLPGTRASWRDRLADRALGLELAALGTILLTHAPLAAAWMAGYAVLGR